MNPLLDAALAYSARGWPVFPLHSPTHDGRCDCLKSDCISPAKHPWTKNGFYDATTDETLVREWWNRWPSANVGIRTGEYSGLIIIDLDSVAAKDEVKKLLGNYDIAIVPRVRTGKGWQLFFKYPGFNIKSRTGILHHVDVRGDSGYVCACPSKHISGKIYQWEVKPTAELPELPSELLKLISTTSINGETEEEGYHERFDTAKALAGVPEGQRDETLFRLACKLRNADIPQDMAERLIQEAAQNCQPPFPESIALEKVSRAYDQYKPADQPPNLTSDYRDPPSEVRFGREVNLAHLQAEAKKGDTPPLTYLPVLGQERLIVKGWSHLLAGYPKAGKTELVVRMIAEWPEERILYITEEPESVWDARMRELPENYSHVTLYYGLGVKPAEILNRIKKGDETVVNIDTVRNLLGLRDETDNSEIARAMNPYIAVARDHNKTLVFLHHNRKGGGEHGEGITGGHAFMGVVDIALEIKFDGADDSRRRQIRGWGRVIEIPKLLYELSDDGTMIALGSPAQVALEEVKKRALDVLSDEFMKRKSIKEAMGDPKPSDDQLLKALNSLAADGKAERDPPLSAGQRPGASYKWRLAINLTSDEASYRSEVRLESESSPQKGSWEPV